MAAAEASTPPLLAPHSLPLAPTQEETPQLEVGLGVVGAIFAVGLVQTLCLQQYFHRVYRVSYMTMAALNVTIYEKSLVISNTARSATSVGETVRRISNGGRNVLLPYQQSPRPPARQRLPAVSWCRQRVLSARVVSW